MSYRANQSWSIDDITAKLLAVMPDLHAQVSRRIRDEPQFMDILGRQEYSEGTIEKIDIIFWTPNKIIHDIHFRSGAKFSDCGFKFKAPIPEALLIGPCSQVLGHPLFDDYRWDREQMTIDDEVITVAPIQKIDLGRAPWDTFDQVIEDHKPTSTTRKAA